MKKLLLIVLGIISLCYSENNIKYFYTPSCHQCLKVNNIILPELIKQGYSIKKYDISNPENFLLLEKLTKNQNNTIPPVLLFNNNIYIGYNQIKKLIKLYNPGPEIIPFAVVTFGGLLDGINPCAIATIIFLLSFLQFKKYKKKETFIIGLSFTIAVFFCYYLIGLGLFKALYDSPFFFKINLLFYKSISLLCLVLTVLTLIDIYKTVNNKKIVLQLPNKLKKLIHFIIRKYL